MEVKELITEIVDAMLKHPRFISPFDEDDMVLINKATHAVENYFNSSTMKSWHCPQKFKDEFKEFCINTISHQCWANMHPLTCGIGGGSHGLLEPRITDSGQKYLVCPTCGWIQINLPSAVNYV